MEGLYVGMDVGSYVEDVGSGLEVGFAVGEYDSTSSRRRPPPLVARRIPLPNRSKMFCAETRAARATSLIIFVRGGGGVDEPAKLCRHLDFGGLGRCDEPRARAS